MQTSDFELELLRWMKLAKQKRGKIMCAEAVPWRPSKSSMVVRIGFNLTVVTQTSPESRSLEEGWYIGSRNRV